MDREYDCNEEELYDYGYNATSAIAMLCHQSSVDVGRLAKSPQNGRLMCKNKLSMVLRVLEVQL